MSSSGPDDQIDIPEEQVRLEALVDACTFDHLTGIVSSICYNEPSVRQMFIQLLEEYPNAEAILEAERRTALKRKALHHDVEDDEDDGDDNDPTAPVERIVQARQPVRTTQQVQKKKPKTTRPGSKAECGHCGDKALINDENSPCRYHKGHLTPNLQWWKDTGAAQYGATEWDESYCGYPGDGRRIANMLAHPEGYTWSCCKADGTTEGCVKALHVTGRKHQYGKLYQIAKVRTQDGWSCDWWSGVPFDPTAKSRTQVVQWRSGGRGEPPIEVSRRWLTPR